MIAFMINLIPKGYGAKGKEQIDGQPGMLRNQALASAGYGFLNSEQKANTAG
jgi:hypothetical protein